MVNQMKVILVVLCLFFSGCVVTNSYNTPFINTDDTIKLEYGMDKTSVYNELGQPLYVETGIQGTGSIIWIYEVRTIEVQSMVGMTGETIPRKTYTQQRHANPLHKLRIEFIDNKVVNWGPIAEVKNANPPKSKEEGKKKKTKKFFFYPRVAIAHEKLSQFEGHEDDYTISIITRSTGMTTGLKIKSSKVGVDLETGEHSFGIMLYYERPMSNGLNLGIGVGYERVEYPALGFGEGFRLSPIKLGISKDINNFNIGVEAAPNVECFGCSNLSLNVKYKLIN